MAPLRFYFDFVSPYAYIAWSPVKALARRHGRDVEPVPVLFAALLDAHGQLGPAEMPAKRAYIFKDAFRKAHRLGLPPLVLPPSHPFNPLVALRVASLEDPPADARERIVDALYEAAWQRGEAIDEAEAVRVVLDRAGLAGADLVARAHEPTTKARLRAATEAAVARGVFGVPTIDADGELFWGSDSLEHVDAFLRGEDPVPPGAAWAARPSSAVRKGAVNRQ